MKWMISITVVMAQILAGCPEDLPQDNIEEVSSGSSCEIWSDCEDVTTAPPDIPKAKKETVSESQCKLAWDFNVTEGGIPSHPLVNTKGVTTVTTGTTLLRIDKNGGEACPTPYKGKASDGYFGTPTQDSLGLTFIGTSKGRLAAVTAKCTNAWPDSVLAQDPQKMQQSLIDRSGPGPFPITAAPIYRADKQAIYVLDERPSLHKCNKLSDRGSCADDAARHYYVLDKNLPGATAVYAGGDTPYIAFPSLTKLHVVEAQNLSTSAAFDVEEYAGKGYEITSTLALNGDKSILFAAGKKETDQTYTDIKLYRAVVTLKKENNAVTLVSIALRSGFPKPIPDVNQDMATSIVIDSDNAVYIATLGRGIVKMNAGGESKKLWDFIGTEVNASVRAMPALGDDGTLYFMSEPHSFFAVNKGGQAIHYWADPNGGELVPTSPAISDSGLVLVHIGTTLKALSCPSSSLKETSWPRYQGDNMSSGAL